MHMVQLSQSAGELLELLEEYYEAVKVIVRDAPEAVTALLASPPSAAWLTYRNDQAVGCVILRTLPSIANAGECKRLYVRPSARGHNIATALLDAQEEYARQAGLEWIYLDSNHKLETAIALYRKRGYTDCERYNANPQATIFLRKRIAPWP